MQLQHLAVLANAQVAGCQGILAADETLETWLGEKLPRRPTRLLPASAVHAAAVASRYSLTMEELGQNPDWTYQSGYEDDCWFRQLRYRLRTTFPP